MQDFFARESWYLSVFWVAVFISIIRIFIQLLTIALAYENPMILFYQVKFSMERGRRIFVESTKGFCSIFFESGLNQLLSDYFCFLEWFLQSLLSHKHKKHGCLVKPDCCPNSIVTILRSIHISSIAFLQYGRVCYWYGCEFVGIVDQHCFKIALRGMNEKSPLLFSINIRFQFIY